MPELEISKDILTSFIGTILALLSAGIIWFLKSAYEKHRSEKLALAKFERIFATNLTTLKEEQLGSPKHFAVRAMFGEYALYADGKVVALVCDDQLYVKILPQSAQLEKLCEKDAPYPGARAHYVVAEDQLSSIEELPDILLDISKSLPTKKKKAKR